MYTCVPPSLHHSLLHRCTLTPASLVVEDVAKSWALDCGRTTPARRGT
jgi:hypothetical protein